MSKNNGWTIIDFTGSENSAFDVDDGGFLKDLDRWEEAFVGCFAAEEGIDVLTPVHWKLIRYARSFFQENEKSPMPHQYSTYARMTVKTIHHFFPKGLMSIHRLAGLPQPKTC
jgi:TusE/DsrC/DsvC family sulfur relay protein